MTARTMPGSRGREEADQAMEIAIGHLLRVGVTVSAVIVLAGGVLYLLQERGARPDYSAFHGVGASLSEILGSVFRGTIAGDGRSLIQLGLLLLIATPIARVVLAAVGFLREKDRLYSAISAAVLAILLYSLLFGR